MGANRGCFPGMRHLHKRGFSACYNEQEHLKSLQQKPVIRVGGAIVEAEPAEAKAAFREKRPGTGAVHRSGRSPGKPGPNADRKPWETGLSGPAYVQAVLPPSEPWHSQVPPREDSPTTLVPSPVPQVATADVAAPLLQFSEYEIEALRSLASSAQSWPDKESLTDVVRRMRCQPLRWVGWKLSDLCRVRTPVQVKQRLLDELLQKVAGREQGAMILERVTGHKPEGAVRCHR